MGHVLLSKEVPNLTAPVTGILASTLSVGSSVYLMENGTAVEYLVVNQGIPSGSSLYDASCDGTWLLRKTTVGSVAFSPLSYRTSALASYLKNTFYNTLGSVEQSTIKQVKIPCLTGDYSTDVGGGADGFSCKVFALSAAELGMVAEGYYLRCDLEGAKLSYFISGNSSSDATEKRATNSSYRTRTAAKKYESGETYGPFGLAVNSSGKFDFSQGVVNYPTRPALILPSNALFDKNTLLLKGVA